MNKLELIDTTGFLFRQHAQNSWTQSLKCLSLWLN